MNPVGSQLSSAWHKFVDGLDVSLETKAMLHSYGMYGVWAAMILGGILLVKIILF